MTMVRFLSTSSHLPTSNGANFSGMQIATAPEVAASCILSLLISDVRADVRRRGYINRVKPRLSARKALSPAVTGNKIAAITRRTFVAVLEPARNRMLAACVKMFVTKKAIRA